MAFRFKGMGYKMTRPSMSPLKSVLGAHSATNENQDDKISKRMTTTDPMTMNRVKNSPLKKTRRSPLKQEDIASISGAYSNPNVGGANDTTDDSDTTDTSSNNISNSSQFNPTSKTTAVDPKTGYYNPFETLAKAVLQPGTERAKQRVENRQAKRNEQLQSSGASADKIARVKARQTDEMNRRFPKKDTIKK